MSYTASMPDGARFRYYVTRRRPTRWGRRPLRVRTQVRVAHDSIDPRSLRQPPDAARGRLVAEGELHERHVLGEVLKDRADALADGDLLVFLERDAVRLHEV